jgi:hypothetical protein
VPEFWLLREIFRILLVLFYVFALPVILAKAWLKTYYLKLGPPRYRHRLPVPHDDVPADQDAASLGHNLKSHRRHPGILFNI